MPKNERWSTEQVAEFLGGITRDAAAKQLHRWGITPVQRQPGRTGQNLYSAAQVRKAHENRAGRGAPGKPRRTTR